MKIFVSVSPFSLGEVKSITGARNGPVDGGDHGVEGEPRVVVVVLVPDRPTVVFAIVRRFDRVVDGDDHR